MSRLIGLLWRLHRLRKVEFIAVAVATVCGVGGIASWDLGTLEHFGAWADVIAGLFTFIGVVLHRAKNKKG